MRTRVLTLFFLILLTTPVVCQMTFKDSVPVIKNLLKGQLPPETRLKFLTKLCAHYWTINPDTSLWYGEQGKALCNDKMPLHRIGRLQFIFGMAWENKGNFDSALHYLSLAEKTCLKAGDTLYQYRTLEQTGSLYRIMGKYDTAVVLMNRSLDYFKRKQKTHQIMTTLFNIGSVYMDQNRYSKALSYYLESASYDSVLRDSGSIAMHLTGFGNIYLSLGALFKTADPEKSKKYLALSKSYYNQSLPVSLAVNMKTGYCFTLMSLLGAIIEAGDMREADSLLNVCQDCIAFPDPRVQSGFSINRALMFHIRGNDREAMSLLAQVSRKKGEIGMLPEFNRAMLLYATLLWKAGRTDSAVSIAGRSLSWAKANSVMPVALEACQILAEWERKNNNNGKAFDYLATAHEYQDSLYREISRETFDQMEFSYNNRVLKTEIEKLIIEKKYNKSINLFIYIVSVFLLVLLIIFVVFLRRRQKTINERRLIAEDKAFMAEQENYHREIKIRNISLENQLKQEEMEKLRLEMQMKEQALVYQAMLNADLNQKNSSFTEKLNHFSQRLTKKKDQDEFYQALSTIRSENQTDPMQQFDLLFKQMHGDFLKTLVDLCPDLSKTDLQICALLRLNFSSKDMARLVNITPASIDGTRHRIRKKLNLDPNTSLTTFLLSL